MEIELHDVVGIAIGKGVEKYAVDQTENDDRGCNTECERTDCNEREFRVFPKLPEGKANVLEEYRHGVSA
jgi:hypothetical protein